MYAEKSVICVHRDLKVHTSYYPNPYAVSTIILVPGSLATSTSFTQTLRYLRPLFNVVLFDMPYAGQSRPYNPYPPIIGKEDEALILLELIEHFRVDQLFSFSWGGVAALLALAQRPERLKRAVICSFSPTINADMREYLNRGQACLSAGDRIGTGQLINDTIGEYLPALYKRCNFRHASTLEEHEYAQTLFQVRQVLGLESDHYMGCVSNISIPLLFINGEWDRFTTPEDARQFRELAPQAQFAIIRHSGHFLEMEHKTALQDARAVAETFLLNGAETKALELSRMAWAC